MNIWNISFVIYLFYININVVNCFFETIKNAVYSVKCPRECCDEYNIPKNITGLDKELRENLFGQHIAHQVVISALNAHVHSKHTSKALAMSFHGSTGVGKNYVARMIIDNFYRRKENSYYVHIFNGRMEFSKTDKLADYKAQLKETIISSLWTCPNSMFIFDEVEMMLPGVLDVVIPFLDFGPTQFWENGRKIEVETTKAIFIFLSNVAATQITKILEDQWVSGKDRGEAKLTDFEDAISKDAFNHLGGFHKSDTIAANVIDHYVPFLPLKQEHVIKCILRAFELKGRSKPTEDDINKVLEHVSFDGPGNKNLHAKGGCKRIESKVGSVVYSKSRSEL